MTTPGRPPSVNTDFGGYLIAEEDVLEDSPTAVRSVQARARAAGRLTIAEKLRDPNVSAKDLAAALGVSERTAQRYRQTGQLPKDRTKDLTGWHRKLRRRKSYDDSMISSKIDAATEARWGKLGSPLTVQMRGSAGISGSKYGIKTWVGGDKNATVEFSNEKTAQGSIDRADDLRRAYATGNQHQISEALKGVLHAWFNNENDKTLGADFRVDPV